MTSAKAKTGRSGRIRTRDRRFWRPLLYQTELHSYIKLYILAYLSTIVKEMAQGRLIGTYQR